MRRLVGGSVISEFRRQLPDVRLEILIQNEAVDLVRDRVDIAIQRGPTSDSSLTVRHLAKVPLWLYAGTQTSGSGADAKALIAAPGDEALLQPTMPELIPAAVVVDDRTSVRDALLEGDGVGILPAFLGEQPRANGDLLRRGNEPLSIIEIEAVSLPEQASDIRTRSHLELITAELRELLGQP
jgi:DNA-binding transcriptional LysR family regulator